MSVLTTLTLQALAVGAAGATVSAVAAAPVAVNLAAVSAPASADAPVAGARVPIASAASNAPASAGATPADKPHCESTRPEYGDTMQVQCALGASPAPRKFKFEVRFLGGHDDTRASLSATLNGQPLTCEEGSKPQLEGEFGEVSIHCQFSSQSAQELKVDVQWHHAQYADYALDAA